MLNLKENSKLHIVLPKVSRDHEYKELVKEFLPEDAFHVYSLEGACNKDRTQSELEADIQWLNRHCEKSDILTLYGEKNQVKRELYNFLSKRTGLRPPWGIITGIRPVKMVRTMKLDMERLQAEYLLTEEKARKVTGIYAYQQSLVGSPPEGSASMYVGIPFCPTRCLYCSFASNPAEEGIMAAYMKALHTEIEATGRLMKGMPVESLYFGGGTPTTLDAKSLDGLLKGVRNSFNLDSCREITVEAGRPDTITAEKLDIIRENGVGRISINPQTLKDETLKLIGRDHTVEEFYRAYELARGYGFVINCDLIACLPGESLADLERSIKGIIDLGAENITVHMLAVKRASRLKEEDSQYHMKRGSDGAEMVALSEALLDREGYRPYYLYRQKHMTGALENTGYCLGDTPSVYNVRIMDENQSIVALGAGAISKRYFPEGAPEGGNLRRVANVTGLDVYMERTEEMIRRKAENLFE